MTSETKFDQGERATYICLHDSGDDSDSATIVFSARRAVVSTASGRSISLKDAKTGDWISRSMPQKKCETPDDTARENGLYGAFGEIKQKAALDMAVALGEAWQAAYIDKAVETIDAIKRKSAAQVHDRFKAAHDQRIEDMQEHLEGFRLRQVKAIIYPQTPKLKRAASQMFA